MQNMTATDNQRLRSGEGDAVTLSVEERSVRSNDSEAPTRIAIVASHAVQYFTPYFRALAGTPGVVLKVFFCRKWGAETYFDRDFKTEVKWDIPLLDGYEWEFLESRHEGESLSFWAMDNPNVGEALKRFQPEVVEIHGYSYRTMWRALRWCNANQVPAILFSDSNGAAKTPIWKRAVKAVIVGKFYRRLDGALSCGDNNRVYHLRYGIPQERVYPRPQPIDCRRYLASVGDAAAARLEIRKLHGIPEDAFVVVFAGKLSEVKCPLHLLQAVRLCGQRGLNVWGLFVGEGALRPALEAYLAEHAMKNAVLAGFVNQSRIGKYYAASEVVTLMSSYEPKGQTVPEAGVVGCPAILSDRIGCIGPNDCARPGENALVYPWADINAFADCIARVYKDRQLYRSMSEAAVRIATLQDVVLAAQQMKDAAVQLKKIGCRR
jgi:glycosyltransferase involved in cell wall biosynthesis